MLREIYMRDPSDPLYSENVLEHSSELENLLGQIRILLSTKKGDVLGTYDFGYNLEDNLFLFDLSGDQMKSKLLEAIYTYCPDASLFNVSVDIQFFKGTVRDACLIDIIIDGQKVMGVFVK